MLWGVLESAVPMGFPVSRGRGWGGIELGPKGQIRQHARARLLVETHLPPLGHLALSVCWGLGG